MAAAARTAVFLCVFASGPVFGQVTGASSPGPSLTAAPSATDPSPPPGRTILQHINIAGTNKDAVMMRFDSNATGATSFYSTSGEEIGYVVSGSMVLQIVGRRDRPLKEGDSYVVPAGAIHSVEPLTGSVTLVVVSILDRSAPLYTPLR